MTKPIFSFIIALYFAQAAVAGEKSSFVSRFENRFQAARVEVADGSKRKIYYMRWPGDLLISKQASFSKGHTQKLKSNSKAFFLRALNDIYDESGDADISTCPKSYVRVTFEKKDHRESKTGCLGSSSVFTKKTKRLTNIIGML